MLLHFKLHEVHFKSLGYQIAELFFLNSVRRVNFNPTFPVVHVYAVDNFDGMNFSKDSFRIVFLRAPRWREIVVGSL